MANYRKLSPEEASALGLENTSEPKPGLRKLSPDEVQALGLETPEPVKEIPYTGKPIDATVPAPPQERGTWDKLKTALATGATLGGNDELAGWGAGLKAGAQSLLAQAAGHQMPSWDKAVEVGSKAKEQAEQQSRQQKAQDRKDSPYLTAAGNLIGGALPAAGAALSAPLWAPEAAPVASAALIGGGLGSAGGALGADGNLADRVKGGVVGGTMGAAMGAAGAAAPVLTGLGLAGTGTFAPGLDPATRADLQLGGAGLAIPAAGAKALGAVSKKAGQLSDEARAILAEKIKAKDAEAQTSSSEDWAKQRKAALKFIEKHWTGKKERNEAEYKRVNDAYADYVAGIEDQKAAANKALDAAEKANLKETDAKNADIKKAAIEDFKRKQLAEAEEDQAVIDAHNAKFKPPRRARRPSDEISPEAAVEGKIAQMIQSGRSGAATLKQLNESLTPEAEAGLQSSLPSYKSKVVNKLEQLQDIPKLREALLTEAQGQTPRARQRVAEETANAVDRNLQQLAQSKDNPKFQELVDLARAQNANDVKGTNINVPEAAQLESLMKTKPNPLEGVKFEEPRPRFELARDLDLEQALAAKPMERLKFIDQNGIKDLYYDPNDLTPSGKPKLKNGFTYPETPEEFAAHQALVDADIQAKLDKGEQPDLTKLPVGETVPELSGEMKTAPSSRPADWTPPKLKDAGRPVPSPDGLPPVIRGGENKVSPFPTWEGIKNPTYEETLTQKINDEIAKNPWKKELLKKAAFGSATHMGPLTGLGAMTGHTGEGAAFGAVEGALTHAFLAAKKDPVIRAGIFGGLQKALSGPTEFAAKYGRFFKQVATGDQAAMVGRAELLSKASPSFEKDLQEALAR